MSSHAANTGPTFESVDEFSKHTSEFLGCIPLLTKARDAYQRAMAVSAEVRSMLDAGDGTLRTLMERSQKALRPNLLYGDWVRLPSLLGLSRDESSVVE
jgi:hypothetical protein